MYLSTKIISTLTLCPVPPQKKTRNAQAHHCLPNPASIGPSQSGPGARTPPGVLAPGASPRVRRSCRGHPRHRKWPRLVCLYILGKLKRCRWLVTVGLGGIGMVSTEMGGWSWAESAFLAWSPARPCSFPWRWAVSEERRPPQVSVRSPGAVGIPQPPWLGRRGTRGPCDARPLHPAVILPVPALIS